MKEFLYFSVFILSFSGVLCHRILGIFPHPGTSHFYCYKPILTRLAEMGHEVTVISHFPLEQPLKNYNDISLRGTLPIWQSVMNLDDFDFFPIFENIQRTVFTMGLLAEFGHDACRAMIENEQVKNLQQGQFDLVIIEQFNTDCGNAIIHKLNVPFVGIASHVTMPWGGDRIGLLDNPSFVPTHFLSYGPKPKFFEVIQSLIETNIYKTLYRFWSQKANHNYLIDHYGSDMPDLETISQGMSLLMTNTYFPMTGAHPTPPNVIEIGGVHLKKASKLPKDLQQYLDESKEGVILFSMGSMIKAVSWPEDKLKAFKEAFAEIPQRILWKWENDTMEGAPKNVKILKWIPQFDLLQHPNVKGFIAHAGMLGIIEAVHTGIPTMMIPMYGDQFNNAACAQEGGLGIVMGYKNITTESIRWGIQEILSPRIQESAKKLSTVWRDRPQSPMDTAIYWIEHVARNGGKHLRSASADLPLYRYLLLDVIAFLSLVFLIVTYLAYKLLSCCCRKSSKPKHKNE